MEYVLFLMSNMLVMFGILTQLVREIMVYRTDGFWKPDSNICYDLKVMLFAGTIGRLYWSHSPPQVWAHEPVWLQILAIIDVHAAPVVMGAYLAVAHMKEQRPAQDWRMGWKVLSVLAVVTAILLPLAVVQRHADESFMYADNAMIFNMVLECLATIPQLNLVYTGQGTIAQDTANFVGLLSASRILRIIFWCTLCAFEGVWIVFASHLLVYILPDVIHTIVMADFLWVWGRRMKREYADRHIQQMYRWAEDLV